MKGECLLRSSWPTKLRQRFSGPLFQVRLLQAGSQGTTLCVLISAGNECTLHIVISLTRRRTTNHVPLGRVTTHRNVSRGCLRGVLTALIHTGVLSNVHNGNNNCILAHPPRRCAINRVLHLARNDLTPITYLSNSYGNYSQSSRYPALSI